MGHRSELLLVFIPSVLREDWVVRESAAAATMLRDYKNSTAGLRIARARGLGIQEEVLMY